MLTYCYIEDLLARPPPTAPIDKIDWHDRDRASERARGTLLSVLELLLLFTILMLLGLS